MKEHDVYAIDLGNGFTKRTKDGKEVIAEPSVISLSQTYNAQGLKSENRIKLFDRDIHLGNDAIKSGRKLKAAVGNDRYDRQEFKEMLFGFIAKDFEDDVTIKKLVAGLPINEYEKNYKKLQEVIQEENAVKVNGKICKVKVEDVVILPQPVGTYLYLCKHKKVNEGDSVMVVDGGHGDFDVTQLKGEELIDYKGDKFLGARTPFNEIIKHIIQEHGELSTLTTYRMYEFLANGLPFGNDKLDLKKDPKVEKILDQHYSDLLDVIVNPENFDVDSNNYVVWTGGIANLHKNRIDNSFTNAEVIVLDNAQEANVIGFYESVKDLIK